MNQICSPEIRQGCRFAPLDLFACSQDKYVMSDMTNDQIVKKIRELCARAKAERAAKQHEGGHEHVREEEGKGKGR